MALTIVETPGAANANSYVSLVEANAYMETRLFSADWTEGTFDDEQKKAALISATSWLDALFRWTGVATTETQALGWPRTGMLSRNGFAIGTMVIPTELKKATSEFAMALATEQRTADNDAETQGLSEIKAGPVQLKFRDKFGEIQSVAMADAEIMRSGPDYAYLSTFIPDAVRNLIPPSWYERVGLSKGLFFTVDR